MLLLLPLPFVSDDPLDFERDVRPILMEHCVSCHGPDAAARKADLRLDVSDVERRPDVFEGDSAELVYRITEAEDFDLMPPPEHGKPLSPEQVAALVRWVAEGATYEEHWAFERPVKADLPEVSGQGWPRNAIDHFVLARLEKEGLQPAPPADRRALARRLSLDLRGLPPEPEEVDAFVADTAPDAYERLVERWMSGAEWGEHRARHWLDLARYADTHGIHFDNYRDIWPYRDWVIEAFTNDVPFDEFSIQQLAGDLLPEPSIEQRVATGFLRCNTTTNEGGLIDEEYKVLYARDRTETFGQVWLGLSVGCAVCHDHKYDPTTQKEFYELSSFFDNTTVPVRDGNAENPGPILRVTPVGERGRRGRLETEIGAAREARAMRASETEAELSRWLEATRAESLLERHPEDVAHLSLPLTGGDGALVSGLAAGAGLTTELVGKAHWIEDGPFGVGGALRVEGQSLALDAVGDFEHDQPFTSAAWVRIESDEGTGALWSRMDAPNGYRGWDVWLQGRRVGAHVIHSFPDSWLKVVAVKALPADTWVHVAVSYDGSAKAGGVKVYYDGVPQKVTVEADRLSGTVKTSVPFLVGARTGGGATSPSLTDLRIDEGVLDRGQVLALGQKRAVQVALAGPGGLDGLPEAARTGLHRWWLEAEDPVWRELGSTIDARAAELDAITGMSPTAHVFTERAEEPSAFVLQRGEYDQRLEEVGAATPAFLPPLAEGQRRDRLALARWLFQPDHPLTARVAANRFWQELFGVGLVATSGDFGLAGEPPSNPELLDWLAVDFQASGWSVKEQFRLMVTSATYRQSARVTAEKLDRDPDNALFSRGPRHRMDAETLRDTALAASGLLVRDVGGPSVKPYQPPGVWEAVAMRESNTHNYRQDHGAALWRRSLYTFWKRSAPPASMEILDAPSRELCTVQRVRTNTPLQALVTLNDPQFVEAARTLAARALAEEEWAEDRMNWLMRQLTSRSLEADEQGVCAAVLADLVEHYAAHPGAALELLSVGEADTASSEEPYVLAAWTMLANMLMNLDETVTK